MREPSLKPVGCMDGVIEGDAEIRKWMEGLMDGEPLSGVATSIYVKNRMA